MAGGAVPDHDGAGIIDDGRNVAAHEAEVCKKRFGAAGRVTAVCRIEKTAEDLLVPDAGFIIGRNGLLHVQKQIAAQTGSEIAAAAWRRKGRHGERFRKFLFAVRSFFHLHSPLNSEIFRRRCGIRRCTDPDVVHGVFVLRKIN